MLPPSTAVWWSAMRVVGFLIVAAILVLAGATLTVAIRTVLLVELAIFGVFLLAALALIAGAWWTERRRLP